MNPVEIGVNSWDIDLDVRGQIVASLEGLEVPYLVDTGATLSLLSFEPKGCKSSDEIIVQGEMGKGK